MAHTHSTADGRETGPEIVDPDNLDLHRHEVDGEITSSDAFGPGHTHEFQGEQTSGPQEMADNDKGAAVHIESKFLGGQATEVKQEERDGVQVGVVKGYIATWDLDRGLDRFVKGAFLESIAEHKAKGRPIRFKDHHGRTIGGFPIESIKEDERGLFGVGEINLEVQQGREAFALAKQGVLSDFSIGFSSSEDRMEDGVRVITKATIWEGSIVDEPMNPEAVVTEVKSVVSFQDLPLADRDREWDSDAAIGRIREFTGSEESPSAGYRNAFVWYDSSNADDFGSYKLPVADVVGGRMVAVPAGIFAAAAAVQGARGGVDLPEADRDKVIRHLERYYAKMDMDSPFKDDDKQFFVTDDVKGWDLQDVEKFLKSLGVMSKNAAKTLASRIDKSVEQDYNSPDDTKDAEDWSDILGEIKSIKI